jgi:bla regulator protein blaR1
MTPFVLRHLFESTLFCLLVSLLACCLRNTATANVRHAVWLTGISKFAIPSVLLAKTGAAIAFLWPAASWLSSLANQIQAALLAALALLPASIVAGDQAVYRCIFIVWSLGAAALFAAWFTRLRQRTHAALRLPANQEHAALLRARNLLGLRMPVQLRFSDGATVPALRGIWRPIVTLPNGLAERLTPAELEAVLLHELAHARRLDNLIGVMVHGLVCVFWFHPLLWLVERQLYVEREHACDELVIACGTEPRVYAAGILKVCKFHLFDAVAAGLSAMTGAGLTRRLEFILDRGPSPNRIHVPRLLLAALAIFMTLFPIAGGYCQQCASTGQTEPKGAMK